MNNNGVTTARQCLGEALAAQLDLENEYAKAPGYRDQAKIAGLHQAINYGFKAGEVIAGITAAEAIENLVQTLEARFAELLDVLERMAPTPVVTVLKVDGKLDAEAAEDLRRQWLALNGEA
jgi:hypothetical protein